MNNSSTVRAFMFVIMLGFAFAASAMPEGKELIATNFCSDLALGLANAAHDAATGESLDQIEAETRKTLDDMYRDIRARGKMMFISPKEVDDIVNAQRNMVKAMRALGVSGTYDAIKNAEDFFEAACVFSYVDFH